MSEQFYTKLTTTGLAAFANAEVTGTKVQITTIAVGDGNGSYYEPSQTQTELVNQVWSGAVQSVYIDPENSTRVIVLGSIPPEEGPFWIRELGLFDSNGDLVAVGKVPATEKPVQAQGSTVDLALKVYIALTNADTLNMIVDPALVWATQEYVDNSVEAIYNNFDFNENNSVSQFDLILPNEIALKSYLEDDLTIEPLIVMTDEDKAKIRGTVEIDGSGVISGITQANIDNIRVDGNTISSTNTDGNIVLAPNGDGVVSITKDIVPSVTNTNSIGTWDNRIKDLIAAGGVYAGVLGFTGNQIWNGTGTTSLDPDIVLYPASNGGTYGAVLPYASATYNLGSWTYRWKQGIFSEELNAGVLKLSSNIISNGSGTTSSIPDIIINPASDSGVYGALRPYSNGINDLGTSDYHWDDIYADNATIQTSDRNSKENIVTLCDLTNGGQDLGLDFICELDPVTYKIKDSTKNIKYHIEHEAVFDETGKLISDAWIEEVNKTIEVTHSRRHAGLIAQDVEEVMTSHGMTTNQFAGLIKTPQDDGSYKYGLRYSEFIAPLIKGEQELKHITDTLKEQNEALQAENTALKEQIEVLQAQMTLAIGRLDTLEAA